MSCKEIADAMRRQHYLGCTTNENFTATEILLRNKQAETALSHALSATMEPMVNRMFELLVRHGQVTTYIAPLTWQEQVLLWNPCNDHVQRAGSFSIKIVNPFRG